MRVCGNCGEAGHNKRTCKKVDSASTSAASNSTLPASESVYDDLDESTREAVDWYMEQRYPGYMKRKKERESNPPAGDPDGDEDEE
jgi:hypothetical protein